jgi:glycosyltransferase involved in cell wall biosynthesis
MPIDVAYLMQDIGAVYGAERATLDLVAALRSRGQVSPRVYLMEETRLGLTQSALAEAWRASGVPVTRLPVQRAFSVDLLRQIRTHAAADGIDLLHCVGYKADVHGGVAMGFGRRCPVVSTVHGWLFRPDWKEQAYARINLWALRRMSAVVALSTYYCDLLQQRGVKARHIPTGFAAAAEAAPRRPGAVLRVGLIGRLSWEKNHAMLLRAAARTQAAGGGVEYLLAGNGPEAAAIDAAIRAGGVGDVVRRVGYQPLPAFFEQVDVVTLCSRIENLPYSLLEAMAAGVPAVVTRVGGMPDLIDDGVNGRVVASDDDAALADVLLDWARQPAVWQALGAAGRARLAERFSVEAMCAAHEALYRSLTEVG